MRTTGFGLSALLIAAGAILAWAVSYEAEGIDLNQVGVILFLVGLGLGLLTLIAGAMGSRTTIDTQREAVVNGRPTIENERSTVVDQEPRV